jgi:hypothetical protein
MVDLPENVVNFQDELALWYKTKAEMAKLAQLEGLLRSRLFKHAFPTPVEGTNNYQLPDDYVLKGKYSIDRKVDEAALTTLTPDMRKEGIPVDALIKRKPELSVSEYRKLEEDTSPEGKKRLHLFDQCLIIKPAGTQQLEIVLPAKKKK